MIIVRLKSFVKSRRRDLNSRLAVYETATLPLSYSGLFFANKRPSLALLLKTRPLLPFPLFNPAYVEVNESQLGQSRRRLLSMLLRQLPSIWSATNGACLVLGLIFAHPHKQHLFPNFLRRYRLICPETMPILCSPLTSPAFHLLI